MSITNKTEQPRKFVNDNSKMGSSLGIAFGKDGVLVVIMPMIACVYIFDSEDKMIKKFGKILREYFLILIIICMWLTVDNSIGTSFNMLSFNCNGQLCFFNLFGYKRSRVAPIIVILHFYWNNISSPA